MRHGTSTPARLLLAATVACALAPLAATTASAGVRQAGPVKVEGTIDNKFIPADLTATPAADGTITIEFTSHGAHTIQSDEIQGFDSGNVNDGETKTVTFKAEPGKYAYYCLYHLSTNMTGTLTVAGGADPEPSPSAAPSSQPPVSASASASVGAGQDDAPEQGTHEEGDDHAVPGTVGNESLERIEAERQAQSGAVSGFKFFTFVCIAFLAILSTAVLFSTRPRRGAR